MTEHNKEQHITVICIDRVLAAFLGLITRQNSTCGRERLPGFANGMTPTGASC